MVSLMAVVALAPLAGEETDAVTTTYSTYEWGSNAFGEFGNSTTTGSPSPVEVAAELGTITKGMIVGQDGGYTGNTFLLNSAGELYGVGYNGLGILGNNSTNNSTEFVRIGETLGTVVDFCASYANLMFKTNDGKVYITGNNSVGQAGLGNTNTPIKVPTQIGSSLGTISKFLPMGNNTFVLTDDGKLYGAGNNDHGILGSSASTTFKRIGDDSVGTVVDFKAQTWNGDSPTIMLFINSDGMLYGVGANSNKTIDDSSTNKITTPTQIGSSNGTIVKFTGTINFVYYINSNGELFGRGSNSSGLGGNGTTSGTISDTQIGSTLGSIADVYLSEITNSAIIRTTAGEIYALGANANGKLASGSVGSTISTPTQIGSTLGSIADVAFCPKINNTFVLTDSGQLYGAGINTSGSLGIGNSTSNINVFTEVAIPEGAAVTSMMVNGSTNGALLSSTSYDVEIASSNTDYGSVSAAAASVPSGTTISTSSNTITLGTSPDATVITATPTASDAQYTYAFDSWTGVPAGGTVTEDLTITANFTRTVNEYTITWKIGEETDTTTVAYGSTPTHADPTPPEGYYFAGWDPEIVPVTGAATYTALFSNMTVTFDAGKGTLSGPTTMNVVQGQPIGELPTPTPKAGYTFTGWFDSEGNEVTSETIVTETESFTLYAQYELDDSLKPVKAMTDLLPLIFVVGIIILMIGTAFYYYRP